MEQREPLSESERVSQILRRNETLKAERSRWESNIWNPAAEFCMPQSGSMLSGQTRQSGEKRGQKVYDGTPEYALNILVSGLASGLVPDNYKWFKWSVVPLWLNQDPQVKRYLQECEDITYLALNDSNYNEATVSVFRQQCVFGTGAKFTEYDLDKILCFRSVRLTEVCFAENRFGRVDTAFREFKWTARNAEKQWGRKCPEEILSAIQSGNHDTEFNFLHAVFPREDYDNSKRDRKNMPWASLWIYPAKKLLLDEGGYWTFPYSVPRWEKDDGSVWGRGPTQKALQDIATLNQQAKSNLIAGHKMIAPPLAIPDGFEEPLNLNPEGRNRVHGNGEIRPIVTVSNLPFAMEQQQAVQKAIERCYCVDVFLMLSQPDPRTATEVLERKQEKLVILGPTIGRQRNEHLDSDLDNAFRLLSDNGHFPPPPEILLRYGQQIKTEYVSPLALAQRRMDVGSTTRVYTSAANIADLTQRRDALNVLNDEEAIRIIADREAAPVEILRSREEVQAAREEEQRQMQEQQVAQQALAMTQGAKDLGSVKTGQGNPNALTDLANAMVGGETR